MNLPDKGMKDTGYLFRKGFGENKDEKQKIVYSGAAVEEEECS